MDKLSYNSLTSSAKELICNGCGAKGGWIKVPNFRFKACCDQHDFYYWRGCSEANRLKADTTFYKIMLEDIESSGYGFFKRAWYKSWAWTYYKAVRVFGKKAFYFAEKMKGQAELNEELQNIKAL